MTDLTLFTEESPFDSIREVRADGTEFWDGRRLMTVMAYGTWERFKNPLGRAMTSAANQGVDVDQDFRRSAKNSGTKPMESFELSRFAAYLVAMNGDPNKPEVAAAQAYFAIRTREAEVAAKVPVLDASTPAGILVMAEQFAATARQLVIESEARQQLAAKVEHDAPLVAKAEAHSASKTTVSRQDFAREVQAWGKKTHGVWILQKHIMAFLAHKGVTVRGDRSDAGQATATAIKNGWAENSKYTDDNTGRTYFTTRLLPKGQDMAWKWINRHVAEHGTLELPRQIGPAA